MHEKDFETIFSGNPMFSTSAVVPERGHDFLVDLDNMSFSEAIKKYTPQTPMWKQVARKMKRLIKKELGRPYR